MTLHVGSESDPKCFAYVEHSIAVPAHDGAV